MEAFIPPPSSLYSSTPGCPASARRHDSEKRAAACAIESVAEPVPAFAWTTSVPASWMRAVSALTRSDGRERRGLACREEGGGRCVEGCQRQSGAGLQE